MPDMVHRNNRDYKNFLSGNYYHLYNRGNNKQHIFIDDEDKKVFLFFLAEGVFPGRNKTKTKRPRRLLPPGSFDVHAYCIMPNHYHLLVKQHADISIARLIQKVCTSYVKYFNKKHGRVGHLFQDKFKAVLINNDAHLKWVTEYIHQNPSEAGISKDPEEYIWSSQSRPFIPSQTW